MNLRFYHCSICGKVITILSDNEIPTICCNQDMEEIVPNRADGAAEKHVPVFTRTGNTVLVKIGSNPHPMTDSHRITWIGLRSTYGFQFKELHPNGEPAAIFSLLPEDHVEAVYAYCNLHGLWYSDQEADV